MGFAPIEAAWSARKWRLAQTSAVALVSSPAAPAATADFSSSFEAGDLQPTWFDTAGDGRLLRRHRPYPHGRDPGQPDGWGGWLRG
jgi:hypothetical protein